MMANSSVRRLRALVRGFRGRRVAVVGDLMLDRFVRGRVGRISPEAPVPVVEIDQPETAHLGGAGNVAANLAVLGGRPQVFGVVGTDATANDLRRELRRCGIATSGVLRDPSRQTTVKMRLVADGQHVVRADWEDTHPLEPRLERRLLAALRRLAPRLDAVVLSDYDKGVLTDTLLEELVALCAARRVPVLLDLKRERRFPAPLRLVLLNQRRAEELSGWTVSDEKSLELVGRHLMARFPCQTLVLTRGSRGMVILERNGKRLHLDAVRTQPWEVFDVTGAGDTVMATLTLALTAGATAHEAAVLANTAGRVVVGKSGTAVATPKELLAALGQ